MLTQSQLKQLATYNPETGEFVALQPRGKIKRGDKLGWADRLGYVEIGIGYESYKAHALAFLYMTGEYVRGVDHIDRNPSNNSWGNLRKATQQENMWNRAANYNSVTGLKGVSPHKDKFKVQIRVFGKKVYLGLFNTAQEAKQHYDEFAELLQGEFVCKTG